MQEAGRASAAGHPATGRVRSSAMRATSLLLLAHAAATLYMTGLIWFVQLVHYPLFDAAAGDGWTTTALRHQRRTTWAVGAPMLVELACAVLLALAALRDEAGGGERVLALTGLVLVGVVWTSTALLQVPAHGRLARGWDPAVHRALVRGNWLRTVAWTARAAIALRMLGDAMR